MVIPGPNYMNFWIQASKPINKKGIDKSDATIADAIETVFPLQTEYAFMIWGSIPIPLSYKYDLSCLIDDAMDLCESLMDSHTGEMIIHWPSNTFNAKWQMTWNQVIIEIHSDFEAVIGGAENQLNLLPEIQMSKVDFLSEWKLPFQIISDALEDAGYTSREIPELIRLQKIINRIPIFGLLYREL
ncbi:hypothetical protein EI77_04715 [Prosthecobacter fusiformis]|uniref:Uncharacterized protein n=1 Tax=Prosthecobacter fusiformis TaxID=48464 RepID=A0A4R7RJU8_9BACT|nr:hypothetical protein [Prosthecobacter fusiformis]TDU62447.1 hypothetical protein EI77_04715 [Prosthecobacter fusiformis]